MKRVSTKFLSAIGLLVFPFCLSGTAEAGQFTCSKPADYYYNCGNKEFPQANFCPSDYRRECGDYSQRRRRTDELKRSAARAPQREEPVETPEDVEIPVKKPVVAKAPKVEDSGDSVGPVETPVEKPVAKAPKKEELAKAPAETPVVKKEEKKDEFEDVIAPKKEDKAVVTPKPAEPAKDPKAVVAEKPKAPAADQPLVLKGKESVCTADADALRGKGSNPKGIVNDLHTNLTAQQVRLINESIRKQFGLNLTPDKTSFTKQPSPQGRSCDGQGDFATFTSGRHYTAGCMRSATIDKKPINLKVSGGKLYYVTDRGMNFGITACVFAGGKVTLNAYSNESNAQYVGNKLTLTSQLKGDNAEITVHDGFKELIGKSTVKVPKEAIAGEDARSVASVQ